MKQTRLIKMLAAEAACAMALSAASAQDPTPCPSPSCIPQMDVYGCDTDGSSLQWVRYTPSSGGPTWPAVVVIHGGGFHGGHPSDPGVPEVCQDLSCAGFLCFAITYRLSQHTICNQPEIYPPIVGRRTGIAGPGPNIHDQMDDVRKAIIAARDDPYCKDRTVYVLGGSAGGTHALFAAVTGTAGIDKPDAVVGLSGPYKGSDLHGLPSPSPSPTIRPFVSDWETYVGYGNAAAGQQPLHDPPSQGQLTSMYNASPVSQFIVAADVPPILLVNAQTEAMPVQQVAAMAAALKRVHIVFTDYPDLSDHQRNINPGSDHAFKNWDNPVGPPPITYTVREEVIAFLGGIPCLPD
jgi:acetyl esterase/lipase